MTGQAVDAEWEETSAYFKRWVSERGRLLSSRSDQRGFANKSIEGQVDGLKLRLAHDRGTILLDVSLGSDWHSGRSVLAFDTRRSPARAVADDAPDGAVFALSVPHIKRILNDPDFARFEESLDRLALERLGSGVPVRALA